MLSYSILLQIVLFLLIFVQDVRERKVYLILFLLCQINSFGLFFLNPDFLVEELILNFFFIGLMIAGLFIYCGIKKISFKNSFGLGDGFFFIIMATSFSTLYFVQNLVFSLIFSLILHLLFKKIIPHNYNQMVPLAGFQALYCSFFYTYTLIP